MRALVLGLLILVPYLLGATLLQGGGMRGFKAALAYDPALLKKLAVEIRTSPKAAASRVGVWLYLWAHLLVAFILCAGIISSCVQ